eukprot:TRINITY_DN12380_c0_g2_i2.p1 TRINITY_DN12380_c0_g2~~TRINITY_DN12380_c0_g2_i2.p1  ORF type:complete len:194 (-),score=72.32 TRINITY_DN12380_c0_g2_i2:168-704(-)
MCIRDRVSTQSTWALNTREKALVKQNEDLRKKNSELLQTLKKQKDLIKSRIMGFKSENDAMKRFAEAAWPWVEPRLDEELKETIRPLIKDSARMNSETTNCTEHRSLDKSHSSHEEAELKHKISSKEAEASNLTRTLKETKLENEVVAEYLKFVQVKSGEKCNRIVPSFIKSLTLSKN